MTSDDELAKFSAKLEEVYRTWNLPQTIRNPPRLRWRRTSTRWWWLKSEQDFKLFETDPNAQGYELLRRLPKYRHQLFFYQTPKKTWIKLSSGRHDLFAEQYKLKLVKLGLVRQIRVSSKAIYFDCRRPSRYLIEALKEELCYPTPLIAGTYGQSFIPNAMSVKDQPIKGYTRQQCGAWRVEFKPEPYKIRLLLPEDNLDGDQVISYFTTFVKDNPPDDFARHRAMCRKEFPIGRPRRRPFHKPAKLALALMVLDCDDIAKLSRRLTKEPLWCTILGIGGTQQHIAKALHNARENLLKRLSTDSQKVETS